MVSNYFMNDISEIKQKLDEITKVITDTVPVESIYLFGSYAYGTPQEGQESHKGQSYHPLR